MKDEKLHDLNQFLKELSEDYMFMRLKLCDKSNFSCCRNYKVHM